MSTVCSLWTFAHASGVSVWLFDLPLLLFEGARGTCPHKWSVSLSIVAATITKAKSKCQVSGDQKLHFSKAIFPYLGFWLYLLTFLCTSPRPLSDYVQLSKSNNLLLKQKRVSLHHPSPTPQPKKKKETKNTFLWVHSAKWIIFQVSNFNFQSIQSLGGSKKNQLACRNLSIQCCINMNNELNNVYIYIVILYVVHGLSRSASLVGLPLGFRLPLDGKWLWGCVISFFGLSRNKAILTSLVELCLWGRDAYVPCLQLTHHAQTYP